MRKNRCAGHCNCGSNISRRSFIQYSTAGLIGSSILSGCASLPGRGSAIGEKVRQCGPASSYTPVIKAAFVRRKEDYGMWWPGAVYDGKAAKARYTTDMQTTADSIGAKLDLRPEAIFSIDQAKEWVAQAKQQNVDGLFLVLLDRQQHSWPTAHLASDSGIPLVIFSPLGSSFTTNTVRLADKPGCVIYCTVGQFDQPAYGMKMLAAGARVRKTRCVVIKGDERMTQTLPDLGIEMQYIPAKTFLDDYRQMGTGDDIIAMADGYMSLARRQSGATKEDVINGIKSYQVAKNILKREKADAITMDCLGALGKTKVSLPCISWSRMNDDGVPAACEADHGAVAAHVLVQYLFGRPGFQQDPVADTTCDAVIGAHCSCPTRLNGFDKPSEPFDLIHHHGNRDAVPRTIWKPGKRITCLDVLPGNSTDKPTELLISAGTVIDNLDVPPAGGCVVSVRAKFDGGQDVLSFPGFHQLFFYGDYKKELKNYCQLYNLKSTIV